VAKDENRTLPIVYATRDEFSVPPFSEAGRAKALEYLRQLSLGVSFAPPIAKPMRSIGSGVAELRFSDGAVRQSFRIIYYRDTSAVVVLAIFEKKSQKTPRRVLEACEARLKTYLRSRKG
jgi:phage-related protein